MKWGPDGMVFKKSMNNEWTIVWMTGDKFWKWTGEAPKQYEGKPLNSIKLHIKPAA